MESFAGILSVFPHLRVGVVGDVILDRYLEGQATAVCREAPVPAVKIHRHRDSPGGAGNTAVNLAVLGACTELLGVVGADEAGRAVTARLRDHSVAAENLHAATSRRTLVKHRIMAGGQLALRYDTGDESPIDSESERLLLQGLEAAYPRLDALIVSDYGYGLGTPMLRETIGRLQSSRPLTLVIDAKVFAPYRGLPVTAGKPNYEEAVRLLDIAPVDTAGERANQIIPRGEDILDATGAHIVAVTLDNEGALILERGRPPHRTYARAVPGAQSVGAGDTFAAALTLALAAGADAAQAGEIASAAAGVVVQKRGTAVCERAELAGRFNPEDKRTPRSELTATLARSRREHKRIVLVRGVFDILHRGHVDFLSRAKALGDQLVVAVGSGFDPTDGRIDRPVQPVEERIKVLAALSSVDVVVSLEEDDFTRVVRTVLPDVLAVGPAQTDGEDGGDAVSFGARLERVNAPTYYSSPELFRRICRAGAATRSDS